jgi:hypothetical protein
MRRWEPELSLMGAIGMTGAALAPSMGSMTIAGQAATRSAQRSVRRMAPGSTLADTARGHRRSARPPPWWSERRKEYGKLGPGFEALVGEFFGIHNEDERRIFVTDGGHYDNLGLLALLRARCETIWCVDAYHRPKHLGRQLERVVKLAETDLSIKIAIDTKRFDLVAGSNAIAAHAVAVGTIEYPGVAGHGTLIVIKLALSPTTPQELSEYRQQDSPFPYHPTWRQWFDKARFDHYRRLGRHVASEAISESHDSGQMLP